MYEREIVRKRKRRKKNCNKYEMVREVDDYLVECYQPNKDVPGKESR